MTYGIFEDLDGWARRSSSPIWRTAPACERRLHRQGRDLSLPRMFQLLGQIQETTVLFASQGQEQKPRIATCLTKMTEELYPLFQALDLQRYQAKKAG